MWTKHTEKRMAELSALVHGQQQAHVDRVTDLLEEIDGLRKLVKEQHEAIQKIRRFLARQFPDVVKNGAHEENP